MATQYDYSMTVWIRLISSIGPAGVAEALEEMLGQNYRVTKIERIEEDDEDEEEDDGDGDADAASGDTLTYALQIDLSFNEHECDGDEVYEDARAAYEDEWSALLGERFVVVSVEILDDALTSILLAEREEE